MEPMLKLKEVTYKNRWPIENNTFSLLLKQAKVELTEHFLLLQDVIDKLSSYVTYLLHHEHWTNNMVTLMLEHAFNKRMFILNIHDHRSFLGPVSRSLHTESFATLWNRKYPSMGYLIMYYCKYCSFFLSHRNIWISWWEHTQWFSYKKIFRNAYKGMFRILWYSLQNSINYKVMFRIPLWGESSYNIISFMLT